MPDRTDLHPYQERMVRHIRDVPRCALWVDMGLGKTVSTLTALADLFDDFEISRALVVAPLRVARMTWPREVETWDHIRGLSAQVIQGTPKQRQALLDHPSDIHFINRELVDWLVQQFRGKPWPYDTLVIDEASSFKSASSRRFKALRRVVDQVERVIELTGTPAPNSLLDLWPQMYLLDRGERLGKTFGKYRQSYFISDYMGYNWEPKEETEQAVHEVVSDLCLTLRAQDYLELPPRIDNKVVVELPEKARRVYRDLEKKFLHKLDEDRTLVASNAAALTGKLLQCANGAVYFDEALDWAEIHEAKLDALTEIVGQADGPVLVAYSFKSDLARIKKALPKAETLDKSVATLDRWNRGEIPVLLAHPASAGHGLNLQNGGHTVVWFGLNWSLELYQQFNARLHRQGQTRPVVIHHIVAEDTVDDEVMEALGKKNTTQSALLNAVKTAAEARQSQGV